MPDKPSSRRGTSKRILLVVGSLVGIAVLALGAGLLVKMLQQQAQQNEADKLAKQLDIVQTLTANGNYDSATATIDEQLKDPNLSVDQKFRLVYMRGTVLENKVDNKGALADYQQAAALKDTQGIEESIGRVAEKLGDKALAIASYKKAAMLIPATSPIGSDEKIRYENMIRKLGGKP